MSYIDSHLLENETVILRTQLHWIMFVQPLAWLIAGLVIYYLHPQLTLLAIIPILFAIGLGIATAISYLSAEFGVTNKRVLIKVGFIRIDSIETLLSKVESIQVHQSIIGRLLGYGTIIVCGTGGSRDQFANIDDPLSFRKQVQEQVEKL